MPKVQSFLHFGSEQRAMMLCFWSLKVMKAEPHKPGPSYQPAILQLFQPCLHLISRPSLAPPGPVIRSAMALVSFASNNQPTKRICNVKRNETHTGNETHKPHQTCQKSAFAAAASRAVSSFVFRSSSTSPSGFRQPSGILVVC